MSIERKASMDHVQLFLSYLDDLIFDKRNNYFELTYPRDRETLRFELEQLQEVRDTFIAIFDLNEKIK